MVAMVRQIFAMGIRKFNPSLDSFHILVSVFGCTYSKGAALGSWLREPDCSLLTTSHYVTVTSIKPPNI